MIADVRLLPVDLLHGLACLSLALSSTKTCNVAVPHRADQAPGSCVKSCMCSLVNERFLDLVAG